MKLHLPKVLFVAVLAACGMAYGDLTVTTTEGKTTVSSADWTSAEYTTVTLFQGEKNASTVTTQQDATILGANGARVEISKNSGDVSKLGDIIAGRTASDKNGQIFIQTWHSGSRVEGTLISVGNNIFLGSSSYNNGGTLRFGMDFYDAELTGQVTLIEDASIGGASGNQNHDAYFTKGIIQQGNHSLTLDNYFGTHFDGGMSIGGITVRNGSKDVSIGAEGTESNMTGTIVNTSSGTLTLTGTFNFAAYGESADFSKYTYASSSYATEEGILITEKGLATKHVDAYYAIRKTGSGNIDVTNATINGATQQADGSYTITGNEEALAHPTYVVVSGSATQTDMAGATDLVLAGGSATITSGGENAFITGDVTIKAGSTLTLTANDALGWGSGAVDSITLVGESNSNRATLTTNGSQTLETNLTLNGHTVINGTGDFEAFGGKIVATGTDNTISATLKVRKPITVEVTNSGDTLNITSALTTSTWQKSYNFDQTLTKAGAGTLTFTGGVLVDKDIDLTVSGGTGTTKIELGAAGGSAKSIKVKDGRTLTLNNVTVSDLRFDNSEGYTGTVVLNGVTGYLNNGGSSVDKNHTFANAIQIGANGLTINNGYTDHVYNFTGAVSGTGNISRTANVCQKQTYNFSDVTNWSGKFVNQSGDKVTELTFESSSAAGVQNHATGTMKVTLKGTSYTGDIIGKQNSKMDLMYTGATGDVTVSGSVYDDADQAGRGTINVTVDNANHTTTFSNWVTVHNLHVLTDSTADFVANSNHFKPESLTLEGGATVGVYTATDKLTEANANLSALTVNGNANMNANLVLANNATVDMHGVLTMGCTVSIGTGTVLTVEGNVTAAPVTLFDSVEGLTLGGSSIANATWTEANGILASINGVDITENGQYVIGYWNGAVSVAAANVPEPATATLSLLALAGLAARRRRK